MDQRHQLFCARAGYAFLPLYAIGFVSLAGFIPTPLLSLDVAKIIAGFEASQTRILLSMVVCIFASACLAPWCVALFQLMRRIQARPYTLSYIQLAGCVLMFKSGLFAWRGLIAICPPMTVHAVWHYAMLQTLFKRCAQALIRSLEGA